MIPKFRVWDLDNEQMLYTEEDLVVEFFDEGVVITDHTTFSSACMDIENFELMQSTGLLDINGKEIYEGDIVLIELIDNELEYVNVRSYLGHVIYDDGVFDVKHSGASTGIIPELYLSGHNYQITLLGNIHQNANLLEADSHE